MFGLRLRMILRVFGPTLRVVLGWWEYRLVGALDPAATATHMSVSTYTCRVAIERQRRDRITLAAAALCLAAGLAMWPLDLWRAHSPSGLFQPDCHIVRRDHFCGRRPRLRSRRGPSDLRL